MYFILIFEEYRLKREERSNAYLTHGCGLPWSVECPKRIDKKPELSANAVAFISCRNRPTVKIAGAAKDSGAKGNGVKESWVRLTDVNTRSLSRLKYKLVYHFKLAATWSGMASWSLCMTWMDQHF